RAFAAHSFLTCRPLRPRGVQTSYRPSSRCRHGLRQGNTGSTLPIPPQSVSRGRSFRGCTGSQLLRPVRLLASPDGSDRNTLPATGGFYVQAFDGAVTLTVAGYDYDIDWTPMSAGLPPAGMAASFAARSHRTWHADFPHHALRKLVHSFHLYEAPRVKRLFRDQTFLTSFRSRRSRERKSALMARTAPCLAAMRGQPPEPGGSRRKARGVDGESACQATM